MPRSRTAGLVLCIAAGLSFLSPSPAAASPLVDEQAYWTCNGFQVATDDATLPTPVPCFNAINIFNEAAGLVDNGIEYIDQLRAYDLSGVAGLLLDVYVGEPLESVPFFGNGLADLATALVTVPAQLVETLIDLATLPLGPFLSALSYLFSALSLAFSWAIGAVFWLGNTLFFLLVDVVQGLSDLGSRISDAVEDAFDDLSDALSDALDDVSGAVSDAFIAFVGYFIDLQQVAALFVTFGSIRDGFQELAEGTSAVVESISLEVGGPFAPVSMPGGVSVDVLAVADTIPSGLEALVYLLSGLFFIFAVVQACGFVAKVTDSG